MKTLHLLLLLIVLTLTCVAQSAPPEVVVVTLGKHSAIWGGNDVVVPTQVQVYAKSSTTDRVLRVTLSIEGGADRVLEMKQAACATCAANEYAPIAGTALPVGTVISGVKAVLLIESPPLSTSLGK